MTARAMCTVLLVCAAFFAPARADVGRAQTLLERIEHAEFIVIGTVARRTGDPTTFGCQRQVLGVESVLRGACPEGVVLLDSSSAVKFDRTTGIPVGLTGCSGGVSWTDGERVLAFLGRVGGVEGWVGSQARGVAPGDLDAYAEKVREALPLLALPHSVEKREALRAWAVSLLDHAATFRDGVEVLTYSPHAPKGSSSLGPLDAQQEARLVRAAERHLAFGGPDFERLDWQLARLTRALPSRAIDRSLAHRVGRGHLDPSQRAAYASLVAGRCDDSELRLRAEHLEQLADSRHAWSEDPKRLGAWLWRFETHADAFMRSADAFLSGMRRR